VLAVAATGVQMIDNNHNSDITNKCTKQVSASEMFTTYYHYLLKNGSYAFRM